MTFFSKLNKVSSSKFKFSFFLILFFYLIIIFLDLIGISLIPVFLGFYLSPQDFKAGNLSFILNFIKIININIFFITLITIFFIKNFLQIFMNFIELKIFNIFYILNSKFLLKYYISKDYLYHIDNNPNFFVRNVVIESRRIKDSILNSIIIFRDIVYIFFIIFLLSLTNFKLTIIIFLIFFLITLLYFKLVKNIIKKITHTNMHLRGILIKKILEIFNSIIDVKVMKKQDYLVGDYQKKNSLYENNDLILNLLKKLPRYLFEIIGIILISFIFINLHNFNYKLPEVMSTMTLFILCIIKLFPSFNSLSMNLTAFQMHRPSANLILNDLLDSQINSKIKKSYKIIDNKNKKIKLNKIQFKDVTYQFNNNKKILNNINITLSKKTIGIMGSSGSGKTTFLNLLTGLLKPSSGKILINNVILNSNIDFWQNKISYVSQNIFLIDDTIKKNIAFGVSNNNIDMKLLNRACEISGVKDFLKENINLDSYLGYNGLALSGGQRQRIGIARAIYRSPKLLILDEALNALDENLQIKIFNNIKNSNVEIFILVSHSTKVINMCENQINFPLKV